MIFNNLSNKILIIFFLYYETRIINLTIFFNKLPCFPKLILFFFKNKTFINLYFLLKFFKLNAKITL